MKLIKYFLVMGLAAFIGMIAISCSANNRSDTSVTPISLPATEVSVASSISPSSIPLPTLALLVNPTIIPYPTASKVQTNAVAFIDLVGTDYSLWVANVDGSGERKLVDIENNSERTSNYLLLWFPDGKWISYISGDDLWIISPDGLVKRKVLSIQDSSKKIIRKYEWSPDSSTIAYAQAADWGDRPSIVIGLLNLITRKVTEIDSYQSPLTITLSWTLDGHYLLLSKSYSFLLFDINTHSIVKEIAASGECSSWWYDQLFWSPDGQWFTYTWHGNGPYYNRWLCVSNLDGTVNYEINYTDVKGIYAIPPAWDKTGDYLYLVVRNYDNPSHPETNPDLRLVRFNVKTLQVERLLSLAETEPYDLFWHVSVSPDGRTLETDARIFEDHQFYIMYLDSLSTMRFDISEIPDTRRFHGGTFWSADNRYVIFSSESTGYFYKLDIQTGEATVISGEHSVEYWEISPVATSL